MTDQLSNILFVPPFLPRGREEVDTRTNSYKRATGFTCKAIDAGDLPVLDYLASPESLLAYTRDGGGGHGSFSLFQHGDHPAQVAYLPVQGAPDQFWILDPPRKRVVVYDDRGRYLDCRELGASFAAITPLGIEVTDTRLYIAAPTKVFVYSHEVHRISGGQIGSEDFPFAAAQRNPAGLKLHNDHFYIPDSADNKVYCYQLDGTQVAGNEFAFHGDNGDAIDIDLLTLADDSIRFLILDSADKQTYGYQADGTRDADVETSVAAVSAPRGLAMRPAPSLAATDTLHVVDGGAYVDYTLAEGAMVQSGGRDLFIKAVRAEGATVDSIEVSIP